MDAGNNPGPGPLNQEQSAEQHVPFTQTMATTNQQVATQFNQPQPAMNKTQGQAQGPITMGHPVLHGHPWNQQAPFPQATFQHPSFSQFAIGAQHGQGYSQGALLHGNSNHPMWNQSYQQPSFSQSLQNQFAPHGQAALVNPNLNNQMWNFTGLPTSIPLGMPTGLPTSIPSVMPTSTPSGMPSGLPTSIPSGMTAGMPTGISSMSAQGFSMSGPFVCNQAGPMNMQPQMSVPQVPPANVLHITHIHHHDGKETTTTRPSSSAPYASKVLSIKEIHDQPSTSGTRPFKRNKIVESDSESDSDQDSDMSQLSSDFETKPKKQLALKWKDKEDTDKQDKKKRTKTKKPSKKVALSPKATRSKTSKRKRASPEFCGEVNNVIVEKEPVNDKKETEVITLDEEINLPEINISSPNISPPQEIMENPDIPPPNVEECVMCQEDLTFEERARSLPRCQCTPLVCIPCLTGWVLKNKKCLICDQEATDIEVLAPWE